MRTHKTWLVLGAVLMGSILPACGGENVAPATPAATAALSAADARAIAKEAFLYGFPLATNYETLHKQAIDTANKDYRAPFNVVGRTSGVATPEDKFVVTPNSDTPYSFLWLDLRAEPVVITMPKIEKGRYYTAQLIDLYTFNFAYLGTRAYGNDGGDYLVAGPGWNGVAPAGVKAVIRCETQFAYVLFRTQLFNAGDLPNVAKIQAGIDAKPLSGFSHQPAPPAAAAVTWPMPTPTSELTTASPVFKAMNFLLQFAPTHPSETDLMNRFAQLDIGVGKTFDLSAFPADMQAAIGDGVADAVKDYEGILKQINAETISSADMFGAREKLANNYLYRYVGAKLGLYGNSGEEAIYLAYFVGADGQPANASAKRYTLHFPKGQLPPAKAFWSLTMYDGKSQLLVANPLKRYLLNSTTLESYVYGADSSLTLYVQKASPGAKLEPNWLPAPDGPFYAILRIYMPAPEVLTGAWRRPPMQVAQ